MERLYCPRCDVMVSTEIKTITESYSVRGEDISIPAKVVFCLKCGEQIFHEELDGENLEVVYTRFRHRRRILTPEKIRAIRTKYGLSQRALGRLLKLGEITINRYENGSLPSDAHNELLVLIEDPRNVKKLLEEVGSDLSPSEEHNLVKRLDNLLWQDTQSIYLASAQALLGDYKPSVFSGFREFAPSKARAMVLYTAQEIPDLSKTKLMKVLFYTDFLHYKLNGLSLSGMQYAHLPHGPAVNRWNVLLSWLESDKVITIVTSDTSWDLIVPLKREVEALEPGELRTLKKVVDALGSLTAKELSDLSHLEKGYLETTTGELISYEYALELQAF